MSLFFRILFPRLNRAVEKLAAAINQSNNTKYTTMDTDQEVAIIDAATAVINASKTAREERDAAIKELQTIGQEKAIVQEALERMKAEDAQVDAALERLQKAMTTPAAEKPTTTETPAAEEPAAEEPAAADSEAPTEPAE